VGRVAARGERYFQHELPCDPSSLVRWRQRIGEEGVGWLLSETVGAAKRSGLGLMVSGSTAAPDSLSMVLPDLVMRR